MTAFASPDAPPAPHPLAAQLTDVVRWDSANAPRSLQTAIGPSEIGQPCARRLAYKLLGAPEVNTGGDPWASYVGTAVHAKLADAFENHNRHLGRTRWLVEQRVEVSTGITGSCDLVDVDTLTVIDHKVVGPSSLKKYQKEGPGPQYRAQAHLYGRGWRRAGLPIKRVALAFYPRAGWLTGLHIWSEPYDETVADEALDRMHNLIAVTCDLQVEDHPDRYQLIPATPGHGCTWCPFWRGGGPADGTGCPGQLEGAS